MVSFSEMAIPFVIFLIAINTLFAAMITLPGDQQGDPNQKLFSDIAKNPDLNKSMFTYVNGINGDTNTPLSTDANLTNAAVQQTDLISTLFNIGNTLTGGGLGYVSKFVGFVTQMAFGYTLWLDYFFNPAWGAFVSIIGTVFKGFFFIIEVYAVVSIFMALVGRRM